MRPEKLQELLEQNESIFLEYKSAINLKDNQGKAKFLKEVLSLSNSLQGHAYLVIGVEDKKKTILGMEGVGEEQIQDVIKEWCRPVIDFHFEIVPLDGKNVGVMTIYSSRPPHTVKKKFGYPEHSKTGKHIKQNYLEEHEVFVRRGSTIEVASPEQIVEMAQQRDPDGLDAVASRLDRIADWQKETAEAIYSQNRRMVGGNDNWESWLAVPIFIALITGALLGWWWDQIPGQFFPAVSSVISIFILSAFAIFRVSKFTFKQAVIGTVLLALAFLGLGKAEPILIVSQNPILRVTFTSFAGALIAGLPVSIVTLFTS